MKPGMSSGENDEQGDSVKKRRSPIYAGGQIRSYECNFCKRGFSNAQALGGHMNIHRKDRAKTKVEPSSHSQVGFWVSYGIPNTRSFLARRPWILPKAHGCDSLEKKRLHPSLVFREEVERPQSPAVAAVEVDLELRLGPEPRKDT